MFSRGRHPYIQIDDLSLDSTAQNPDYDIPLSDLSSNPLLKRHAYSRSLSASPHPFHDSLDTPKPTRSNRASSDTLKELPKIPKRFSWSGWRFTVTAGLGVTTVVFFANIILLGWAYPKLESSGGNALLYKGDCDEMKKIDTWSHFGINVLSTLLLGASNAAMQCLVAPSREDIDRAHPRGRVLEIGINGLANWRNMGWRRRSIWFALVMSSFPLHLFYNSIIFSSTSTADYVALVADDRFVQGAAINGTGSDFDSDKIALATALQKNISVPNALRNLSNSDCITAFGQNFVPAYLNVVVITEGGTSNLTIQDQHQHVATNRFSDLAWICDLGVQDSLCNPQDANNGNWRVDTRQDGVLKVKYCLAQPTQPSCTVELFPGLLYTVIACNAVKAVCFVFLIFTKFDPFVTMGDAISSFLDRPDPTTAGLGAMSARDVRGKWRTAESGQEYWEELNKDRLWKNKRYFWFSGASPLRWIGTLATCIGYWLIGISLLEVGLGVSTHATFSQEWAAGLGTILPNNLISGGHKTNDPNQVIQNVLIANIPQVVLSLVYVQYNGLFTCMLLSREWASYSSSRKGLRTSIPQGTQRSSYWLSLPYKFSLPLLVASGLLHWLLSQSLFLAEVNVFDNSGNISPDSISTVGWSGLSLTLLLALGGTMILTIIAFGFMRYAPGIPIASSNSRAISAACHPLPGRHSEHLQKVQYGVMLESGEGKGRVGFSGRDVSPLVDGHVYT